MSAEIDTEAWVTSLARAICEADGGCACQAEDGVACEDRETQARAAISHLLPLIVERCAETADEERRGFTEQGQPTTAFGAKCARDAIRALIPAKGGDHA